MGMRNCGGKGGGRDREVVEVKREIFKPLGFVALPRPERKLRCFPITVRAPARLPQARSCEGNWVGERQDDQRKAVQQEDLKSSKPLSLAVAAASADATASAKAPSMEKAAPTPAVARSKLSYLLAGRGGA